MTAGAPTKVERWRFTSESRFRLSCEVEAQPDHVKIEINDMGYDQGSRLGLSIGDHPNEMAKLASTFRELADTIDAACATAKVGEDERAKQRAERFDPIMGMPYRSGR